MRKDLVATSRIPHRVALYSERLNGYRTFEQIESGLLVLKIRSRRLSDLNPMARTVGPWMPAWIFLPGCNRDDRETILYTLLSDILGQSGYPFSALNDIEVIEHAPHSLTVFDVNRRKQLVSVQ